MPFAEFAIVFSGRDSENSYVRWHGWQDHEEKRDEPCGVPLAPVLRMAGWKDFREIGAWQLARDLKLLAYELLKRPRVASDFDFRDQLRDSARSAPRNIAEGFGRFKHKEFAQFARVAKGSEAEVLNHFIDAVESGYMSKDEFPRYEHAARKALKAVNGLIYYLETTPDPPQFSPHRRTRRKPNAH